jgi:membrane-associated phospholipid phosphatase
MKDSFTSFVIRLYSMAAVMLIILSMVIKKGNDVLWINGNHSLGADLFFSGITCLGNGVLFIPLVVCLLFVQFRLSMMTSAVWISHGLVCAIIKKGLFRFLKRPKALMDNDLLHFVPHVDVPTLFSFPSGHTATIFCLAILLSLFLKNRIWAIILLALALIVGYSRIYLLQHFLMDVAAGAAIGVAVTYFWLRFFERSNVPPWMNNSIKIYPNLILRHSNSK